MIKKIAAAMYIASEPVDTGDFLKLVSSSADFCNANRASFKSYVLLAAL